MTDKTYNTRDRTIIIIIIDVRECLCKWTAVFNEALHLFSIHSSIVLPDDVCCLFVCVFFAFDYRSLPLFAHFMNQVTRETLQATFQIRRKQPSSLLRVSRCVICSL